MRLATINTERGTRAAILENGCAQVLALDDVGAVLTAVERGESLGSMVREEELDPRQVQFLPPVVRPEKVVCVGLNYHAHAAEANLPIPQHPLLFPKYARALVGAGSDILIPPETQRCDWEAELALVIGKTVRRIGSAQALDAVAGYTVMNDISMRDWQKHTSQMMPGKTFESSTPVGPWLVSPEEVDHARNLRLTCSVNGREMQRTSTGDMIFSPAEVIAYISTIMTLVPGDVIALGTPAGIGSTRTPPVFLQPGDLVVTECEGIGVLQNRCVAETIDED
ncbi:MULTISPECIES: fumarylacetoacetate hydrolase family protein [Microbacterium]|uniref:Acylpyruvate hydrolase n=1 Tax=Microbacterium saccharophilum TaxID=1213358 RepID=A0A7Z7D3C4_9MICO|nr:MULTISPECIES: fumarylacetoacetate hydrolase family protein [Microbacterium]SFI60832.1 acylpyruvate hydrolase [Microbacterium saccharophilum]